MKPWRSRAGLTINPGGTRQDSEEANLLMAGETLSNNEDFDMVLYTDGSAVEGNTDGGAGVVVTRGSMSAPEVLVRTHAAAGKWCSSFQAELVALREAAEWLTLHADEWRSARIATDSQSALMGWTGVRYNTRNKLLQELETKVVHLLTLGKIVEATWIPSHCGVPGNEMADAEAAEGASCEQAGVG
jgi:ribonuclease HI